MKSGSIPNPFRHTPAEGELSPHQDTAQMYVTPVVYLEYVSQTQVFLDLKQGVKAFSLQGLSPKGLVIPSLNVELSPWVDIQSAPYVIDTPEYDETLVVDWLNVPENPIELPEDTTPALVVTDEGVEIDRGVRHLDFTGDVDVTPTGRGHEVRVDVYARIRTECDGGRF